jgi:CubicO group peptidase (beta-lactamase class C family)
MSTIQKKLQSLLDTLVADGRERGMQLAVYQNGKLIVDAFAGYMDPEKSKKVDGDTLFPIFSVTKGVVATAAHRAVEKGQVGYDTPIAKVWPEFAANGKGGITFRHALTHTAGMQMMGTGLVAEDLIDWDKMCRMLAEATPVSPPGEQQVYHAVTYGWLVGEVLRRVDGRGIQQIVREDICNPLGIRDMFIGIPDGVDDRVAILEHPGAGAPPADDMPREVAKCMWPLHTWMNHPAGRRACVPGSSGIMSARAIAKHYAALLPGGIDGVQLISDQTLQLVMQDPGKRFGWMTAGTNPNDQQFGHGGFGGANGYAIPKHGVAVGLAKNRFDFSGQAGEGEVFAAIKRELGIVTVEAPAK